MNVDHSRHLTRSRRAWIIVVLGLLTGLGPFTIDLYLPAFPQIVRDFDTTDGAVQVTLSATTLGFALGQLVVGPLSDRLGRRVPLLVANSLHIIASVAVALSPSIEFLTVMRVAQGFGAAGGAVVAMAIVRDLFDGNDLITALSRLALIMGLAPVIAPAAGSVLVSVMNWHGLFWLLAGYGAVLVALQFFVLFETLPPEARDRTTRLRARYRRLFSDRVFVGATLLAAGGFGVLFAYLSSSSLLLQQVYGFGPLQFGIAFVVCSLGIIAGSQVSPLISRRFGAQWTVALSSTWQLASALFMVITGLTHAGVWVVLAACFVMTVGQGLANPAVQALGLSRHGRDAGTAASILGASGMLAGAVMGPILGRFEVTSSLPMGLAMLACALITVSAVWLVVRPTTLSRPAR